VVEQSFFHENYADEKGGAVYIKDVNGIEVVECRFLSNEVGTDGGAIAFYDTVGASLSRSVFDGNISPDDGGKWLNIAPCTCIIRWTIIRY
jgi:predicted outer membrane repeat protein